MKRIDVNACKAAFYELCVSLAHQDLININECRYWVFELGYESERAGMDEFSRICDLADKSELQRVEDCQYWLFERGYLAAKKQFFQLENLQQPIESSKKFAIRDKILAGGRA